MNKWKIAIISVLMVFLFMGCKTVPVDTRIVTPDISVFEVDVFGLYPLITEPQTDADLMYNSLVIEMDGEYQRIMKEAYKKYNEQLRELLNPD